MKTVVRTSNQSLSALAVDLTAPEPITDTPFIHRNKRIKFDSSGSSDNNYLIQLVQDVSELKQIVISCDSKINNLVEENSMLKNELSEIKKMLTLSDVKPVPNLPSDVIKPVLNTPAPNLIPSYADALKQKQQKVIVIKPKISQDAIVTKKVLNEKLILENFAGRGVRNTKNGGVIIECLSSEDRKKLHSSAVNKLGFF